MFSKLNDSSSNNFFSNDTVLISNFLILEDVIHCVKTIRIWSYSGPQFPAFGLKMEKCRVSLRIQSECGKMWTRKTPNTDTFHTGIVLDKIQPVTLLIVKEIFRKNKFYFCNLISKLKIIENEQSSYKQ